VTPTAAVRTDEAGEGSVDEEGRTVLEKRPIDAAFGPVKEDAVS
jgi:hypothetical protein